MLNGSHEDSFSQLPYYCHNLKLSNEGTVTHVQTDKQGRFEMLFVGFGFAILPIAMGVTYSETGASWTWFMNRLKECIGEVPNLCIISDRHPTIILAYKTVSSNYVEPVNSLSRFLRKLPITRLVEYFKGLLQRCRLEDPKIQTIYYQERKRLLKLDADWDDLVEEEPNTSCKRRSNVNSCPLQILPVSVTKNFIGLREWDGPAEWRQRSYNQMNNFMPTARYSSNNTYDPTQPSSSHGYMLHQNAGESSTPYESYHLDDM
uniref:Uncharacterized protein n=1 Tax=Tanacetum cinerariifolium TaxID=118510 RepID=A0A699GR46_TANCI|nr:hypothetical protein [Tanacetum cinerariifolium]